MNVKILTPEEEVFNGNVYSLTLPGKNGLFQVLNFHIPIIAILIQGKIILKVEDISLFTIFNKNIEVQVNNNQLIYLIQGGLLEVNNNNEVFIFCY